METQKGKGSLLVSQQRGGADRRGSLLSRGCAGIPAVQTPIVFIMHEATLYKKHQAFLGPKLQDTERVFGEGGEIGKWIVLPTNSCE